MGDEGVPKLKAYIAEYMTSCPHCSNALNEPRSLDCLHVYCTACVDEMMAAAEDDKFACTVCGASQEVSEGGGADLQPSHIQVSVHRLASLLQQEDTQCTSCAENPAETACYTCGEMLCADCGEKHGQLSATRDHATCALGELLLAENLIRYQRERFDKCEKHGGDLMKLYCKRCKEALCNICVYDSGHQKHDVTSIHNKVDDEVEVVAKKMSQLQNDVEGHEETIATLEEKLTSARDNQQAVLDKIDGYVQQMHDMLDTYKASLVQQVSFGSANQIAEMEAKMLGHRVQLSKKLRLQQDSAILPELPLGSVLPSCQELLAQAEKCKRPYAITRAQLDRSNPEQDFVGRDPDMTQEAINSTLKSLVGFTTPIPPSAARTVHVIDMDDVDEKMQKAATELIHDVIDAHADEPRGNATFKAMAKEVNDKWKKTHRGSWQCCVSVPGLTGKAGFSGKKHNVRVEVDGVEWHLFLLDALDAPAQKEKKKGLF